MSRDYICRACNYNTLIKCNYIKHLNTKKHLNSMSKIFCNLCKKNFNSRQKLVKHLKKIMPCDTLLKPEMPVQVLEFRIRIIFNNLNYVDRIYYFNFQLSSIGIDDIYTKYLFSKQLYKLKFYLKGIDLFLTAFKNIISHYLNQKKYLIFNPLNTDIILIKSLVHYDTYELFNLQLFQYIIRIVEFNNIDTDFNIDIINIRDIDNINKELIKFYKINRDEFIKLLI